MITYHPETTNTLEQIEKDFQIILDSLDHLENTLLIFTKANADVGGRAINNMIDDYVTKRSEKAISFMSLGQLRYLSALHYVDAIIGNSSSGIVEAPTFKVPSINIGNRQKGRIRAESVIDVLADENEIIQAINRTYTTEYKNILASVVNPYGQGESSTQVLNILKNINLASLQTKSFYDVSY